MSETPGKAQGAATSRLPLLLGLMAAAVLGLAPFVRVVPLLGAHVRRASAELMGGSVPFTGSLLVGATALVLCAALAAAFAQAARRRVGWGVPLVLLAFAGALFAGYIHRINARDHEGAVTPTAIVWTRDLSTPRVPFQTLWPSAQSNTSKPSGAVRTAPKKCPPGPLTRVMSSKGTRGVPRSRVHTMAVGVTAPS